MQVKRTFSTKTKTSSEIDLFSDLPYEVPEELRAEVSQEVGDLLKEEILKSVANVSSPISGGAYKTTLSKEYAKFKKAEGHEPVPNLELSGEMLDELDFKTTSKGLEIGVFGEAAPRADGHNNFSGKSNLPRRQFLPEEGQKFKSTITKEIDKIIRDKLAEQINASRLDFATIRNEKQLFAQLRDFFPDFSRAQIIDTVTRSPELSALLNEFNLLRFLSDGES